MNTIGNAGAAILAYPAAGSLSAARWEGLALYRGEPRPCEVQLSASLPSNVTTLGQNVFPSIGAVALVGQESSTTWEPRNAGAFRITYGAEGVSRELVVDLRSAKLFLGTCDSVRVEAMRWRAAVAGGGQITGTILTGAAIAASSGGAYDEPTCTVITTALAGDAISKTMYIPAHARYFVPIVHTNNLTFWGGATPDIQFMGAIPTVVYRPASRQLVPSFPRYEIQENPDAYMILVSSGGVVAGAQTIYGARFYLST